MPLKREEISNMLVGHGLFYAVCFRKIGIINTLSWGST